MAKKSYAIALPNDDHSLTIFVDECKFIQQLCEEVMHLSLTPELETKVKSKVNSKLYNNANEVIREALRFMELNHELVTQLQLDRLRSEVSKGAIEAEKAVSVHRNEFALKLCPAV